MTRGKSLPAGFPPIPATLSTSVLKRPAIRETLRYKKNGTGQDQPAGSPTNVLSI